MKRTIIVASTLLACLTSLTACGSAMDLDAAPNVTPASSSEFTPAERDYLKHIRTFAPEYATGPKTRHAAVKTGHTACDALDRGVSFEDIIESAAYNGSDGLMVATILTAAPTYLCPAYEDDLEAWLDTVPSGDFA